MADPAITPVIDEDHGVSVDPATGDTAVKHDDGSVVVSFGAVRAAQQKSAAEDWFRNLAKEMAADKLNAIATELLEAIDADDKSRAKHLSNVENGLTLMGFEIKKPKSVATDTTSAVEGQSTVTNPLLAEGVLRGWANTVGELLPADGPAKVKDVAEPDAQLKDLADALERDFNHYLTDTASEYYPDTSDMILWGPYFRGCGIKKVYRCPMRRRPVSESVDTKDFIVDNATKDLRSCGRITHRIMMRPSVFKRMQLLGVYLRVPVAAQPSPEVNRVDQKIAAIQGTDVLPKRPEDQPYTIFETQCELDLDEYAPANFKGEGIPLPYRVTIDKDDRRIVALHRDWNEDDEQAHRKRMYVKYPYVPGPGFYGTGLLNILGNSSAAMTGAWRLALDAGQYANFPAGLGAKEGARQNSNIFRLAPGEWASVDTGGKDIRTMFMGLPYKDVTPGLLNLIDRITQQTKSLGGSADIPAAEGIQNVPVGTMLAQIEQATKVMAAAHKGMHQAQSEELGLLIDLFKENPEDFWRDNTVASHGFWDEQKFLQALQQCPPLVPVSDPNVPSHIHRVAKALGLLQLSIHPKVGPYLDGKETAVRCLRALKEPEQGLLIDPPPQQAQPDPNMIAAYARLLQAEAAGVTAQAKIQDAGQDQQIQAAKLQTERDIATTDLAREYVIHGADQERLAHQAGLDRQTQARENSQALHGMAMDKARHGLDVLKTVQTIGESGRQHGLDVAQHVHDRQMDRAGHALDVAQAMKPEPPKQAGT